MIEELIEKLRGDCAMQRVAEHCGSVSTVEVSAEDLEVLFSEIHRLTIINGGPYFTDPTPPATNARELKAADRKRIAAKERGHLSSLLAIIHRDGGHHETEVGCNRAYEHAVAKLQSIYLPACDAVEATRRADRESLHLQGD